MPRWQHWTIDEKTGEVSNIHQTSIVEGGPCIWDDQMAHDTLDPVLIETKTLIVGYEQQTFTVLVREE